jgi:hypothetical protein
MTLANLKQFLYDHPGYLKKGDWAISAATDCPENVCRLAKQEVKEEIKRKNENVSVSTGGTGNHEDFEDLDCYQEFLRDRGISPEDVVSVKHWQNMAGDPRFSVVTKNEQTVAEEDLREAILADIRKEAPGLYIPSANPLPKTGNLAVYHIPDIHLGKVAPNWTLGDATRVVQGVLEDLIQFAQIHNPEHNLLPLGHDILQVDYEHVSRSGTMHTTSSLTPVEMSVTKHSAFRAARHLGSHMIRRLSALAPTDTIIVPSNHSENSDLALGEVWKCQFEHDDRIRVDNDEDTDKVFEWGLNSLLMTHGHTVKWENLPLLFAVEYPQIWGRTKYREVLTGHFHHSKKRQIGDYQEMQGVTCRISPSLSPTDRWHRRFGYYSIPGAEVFIYNREKGIVAHYMRKIL